MRARISKRTLDVLQFVFLGVGLTVIVCGGLCFTGRWGGGSLKAPGLILVFLGLGLQFSGIYFYYLTDWKIKGGRRGALLFILSLVAVIVVPMLVTGSLPKLLRAIFR